MTLVSAAQILVFSFLIGLLTACDYGENDEQLGTAGGGATQLSDDRNHTWRLIVTRAAGQIEVVNSLDQPVICDTQDDPKIVYFCGTRMVEGQPLPVAWDFLPVNLDAGEMYSIEGPPTQPTQADKGTPTATVIGPSRR